MSTAEELIREIGKLHPSERVRLIDKVISSTITPDAEIEQIWVNEAQARWDAFEKGDLNNLSYQSVMGKYRQSP